MSNLLGKKVIHSKKNNTRYGWVGTITNVATQRVMVEYPSRGRHGSNLSESYAISAIAQGIEPWQRVYGTGYLKLEGTSEYASVYLNTMDKRMGNQMHNTNDLERQSEILAAAASGVEFPPQNPDKFWRVASEHEAHNYDGKGVRYIDKKSALDQAKINAQGSKSAQKYYVLEVTEMVQREEIPVKVSKPKEIKKAKAKRGKR